MDDRKRGLAKELMMTALYVLFFASLGHLAKNIFTYLMASETLDWARESGVSTVEENKIEYLKLVTELKLCLDGVSILVTASMIWYFLRRSRKPGMGAVAGLEESYGETER